MPSELQTSKTFFLISGIINIAAFVFWGGSSVFSLFSTCCCGCFLGLLPVVNIISTIMDFIAYGKLSSLTQTGTFKTVQTAALFQIATIVTGNIPSFVFGIVTLNNLSKDEVKNFLSEKKIF